MCQRGRFFFYKRWATKQGISDIITRAWSDLGVDSSTVLGRIASCRTQLSRWKRLVGTNSLSRINRLKHDLDVEVSRLRPNTIIVRALKHSLSEAYHEEELYWKQKSNQKWLHNGDRNTQFFHSCVKGQRDRNFIPVITNTTGVDQFSEGSKGVVVVSYFRELFTPSSPISPEALLHELQPRVSLQQNQDLVRDITDDDIRRATFSIKSDCALGADGMTGFFFQTY